MSSFRRLDLIRAPGVGPQGDVVVFECFATCELPTP